MEIRILAPADEPALEAYLRKHLDSSLFLLSNLRAAGIRDTGALFSATYAAAIDGDGAVRGVAAHGWNGALLVQSDEALPELARAAVAASERTVTAVLGPHTQVKEALLALGLQQAPVATASREVLMAMPLAALLVPAALTTGAQRCRSATAADLDRLIPWRLEYCVEALGATRGPELAQKAESEMSALCQGSGFVLEAAGETVAFSAFTARLPEVVLVGGVYTPPSLRGQGYGRTVVAGQLLAARGEGVGRAVLFTSDDNRAAQAAYRALGFQIVGDYGIVLMA